MFSILSGEKRKSEFGEDLGWDPWHHAGGVLLWDEIREKIFKNYALKSMHECTPRSGRQSPTSSAIRRSITSFPILSTHSDVETVVSEWVILTWDHRADVSTHGQWPVQLKICTRRSGPALARSSSAGPQRSRKDTLAAARIAAPAALLATSSCMSLG